MDGYRRELSATAHFHRNKHPRNSDNAGLGNWEVMKSKLPGGIPALVKSAKEAENTYSGNYLMKVGINAFTTNQAFSRVIEITTE